MQDVSLFDAADAPTDRGGLMIAGDQVLPRITSNVSVYPTEPRADPLRDWLDSIETLRDDHRDKLAKLGAFCAAPCTVVETFPVLFRLPVSGDSIMAAIGEALAHLHWLEARGVVSRDTSGAADRFVRA